MRRAFVLLLALCCGPASGAPRTLESAFPAPPGFTRVDVPPGSFAAWLRVLPLQPDGTPVRAHDGRIIVRGGDPRVAAVATLDVGKRDLQQCADSILRLRDEWLRAAGRGAEIEDRLTSGDVVRWQRWAGGDRPHVERNRVRWSHDAAADASNASFRRYLDFVFTYAGTLSLDAEGLRPPRDDVRPGDYLVQGGSPGHVVLILDVARAADGRRRVLVGQGYTPAQSFHVLRQDGEVWLPVEGSALATPFWDPFPWTSLRRFRAAAAEPTSR